MKQLSQDETCACRTVQKTSKIKDIVARFPQKILSQKGFSLPEFVTSAAISTFLAGVAVVVFMMAFETYNRMVRQYEAEIEISSAMLAIKSALTTAVKVNYCGNMTTANNGRSNRTEAAPRITTGCIYAGNRGNTGTLATETSGGINLVAMVVKDTNIDNDKSNLRATAIYYQRPTQTTSGALYIDTEQNNGGGWVRLSPLNAPQMFTRLVEFQAFNAKVFDTNGSIRPAIAADGAGGGRPIASIEYRLKMRYYTGGKVSQFNWTPAASIPSLPLAARRAIPIYRDVEKRIKVNFVNNDSDRARYLAPRVLGNVHLFNIVTGTRKKVEVP